MYGFFKFQRNHLSFQFQNHILRTPFLPLYNNTSSSSVKIFESKEAPFLPTRFKHACQHAYINYSKQSLSFFLSWHVLFKSFDKKSQLLQWISLHLPPAYLQQKKAKYVSQKRRLRLLPTDPHNILSFCAWNLRKIKMAVGHLFQFSGELPRCGYNRLCNNVILLQNVFPYLTYFVVLNNALNEFHGIVYIK